MQTTLKKLQSTERTMEQRPVGMRFDPTDKELTLFYLKRKIYGQELPDGVIMDCDLYGDKNPWQLFNRKSREPVYVFAKLKKRKQGHSNIVRTAGSGTWKGQNSNLVKDSNGNVLWLKKDFVFEVAKDAKGSFPSNIYGHWLMVEYSLKDEGVDNWVVCRIYNKYAKDVNEIDQATILADSSFVGDGFDDNLNINSLCMEDEDDQNAKRMRTRCPGDNDHKDLMLVIHDYPHSDATKQNHGVKIDNREMMDNSLNVIADDYALPSNSFFEPVDSYPSLITQDQALQDCMAPLNAIGDDYALPCDSFFEDTNYLMPFDSSSWIITQDQALQDCMAPLNVIADDCVLPCDSCFEETNSLVLFDSSPPMMTQDQALQDCVAPLNVIADDHALPCDSFFEETNSLVPFDSSPPIITQDQTLQDCMAPPNITKKDSETS